MGKAGNWAENKENSALPECFAQTYPQIPWTAFLLPTALYHCSQSVESTSGRGVT